MKSLTWIVLVVAILCGCTPTQTEKPLSATELINKCIAHHDPNNTWGNFSGKMRLVYVGADYLSDETIEINTGSGFHQTHQQANGVAFIKGIRNNTPFRSVNGDSTLTEKEIEQYGVSDDQIRMIQNHHYCHVGLPMQLLKSGALISDSVQTTVFNNRKCYVLSFEGKKESVINPYYEGARKVYIDTETFALQGQELSNSVFSARQLFIGEINTNGIIMPQVKTTYGLKDNTLLGTDVFMPVKAN